MGKKHSLTYTPNDGELRQELQDAVQSLREAYDKFNYVSDPELVDACVYEINALKARCNYLLRRIKALQSTPIPEETLEEDAVTPCVAASAVKGGHVCHL